MPFPDSNETNKIIRKIIYQKKIEKIRFYSQQSLHDEMKIANEAQYNKLLEIKKLAET